MIIYKITNKNDGKFYIGQTTKSLEQRFSSHCKICSKCTKLSRAIQKYGKENFTIEIIEICNDMESLNKREEYWIKKTKAIENGYNLMTGGRNSVPSRETRDKLSRVGAIAQNRPEVKARSVVTSTNMWKDPKYKARMSKVFSAISDSKKMSKKANKLWKNKKSSKQAVENSKKTRLKGYSRAFNVFKALGKKGNYTKGDLVGVWYNKSTCAEDLGISDKNIASTLKGKFKSCKGFIFEYITS